VVGDLQRKLRGYRSHKISRLFTQADGITEGLTALGGTCYVGASEAARGGAGWGGGGGGLGKRGGRAAYGNGRRVSISVTRGGY